MRVWKKGDRGIPPGSKYVGRPSIWGNPYVIGRDGTREEVIAKFEIYGRAKLSKNPHWLDPLKGRDLVCWCGEGVGCHGDVLIKLIEEQDK